MIVRTLKIVAVFGFVWLVFGRISPLHAEPQTPLRGSDEPIYHLNLTSANFDALNATYNNLGFDLVDIEVTWVSGAERYSAIWAQPGGTVYTLIQEPYSGWETFFTNMTPKNGRYLDVEVDYFNGVKLYSAIFWENGDNYPTVLRTTNSDAQFQTHLNTNLNNGYALTDFEAYTDSSGNTRYAGVWSKDPNQPQTTLYYGLESADVSELISPRIGRVIDIERYYSSTHDGTRWAMLFAMDSGGEQYQRRGDTATGINNWDGIFSDSDTFLIDIDSYDDGGTAKFLGLWGDTYKAFYEVDAMASDPSNEAIGTNILNLLTNFETGNQGVIGLYAKNVRTNQSIMYRADEPFYLASTAKIPIHLKFWREVQNGHLNLNTSVAYTSGANAADPWYTGHRNDTIGLDDALGVDNFGQSFTLQQYDTFMMNVSDNAGTSLLMDDPTSGLTRDGYDVNEWLADIPGVGQGWGLVTSIQDLDRNIVWQGQVEEFPDDDSYFLAPPWAVEARFRWTSWDCNNDGGLSFNADGDCWGDQQSYFSVSNNSDLPDYDRTIGHQRYYNQGMNTATPRATALLLEKLVEGSLLDATNTQNAIQSMTEGSPFDWYGSNANGWPNAVQIWAKGGIKGSRLDATSAVSDAAIFNLGPDDIVVAVLTENNTRPSFNNSTNPASTNGIRDNFMQPLGPLLLNRLSADLESCRLSDFNPKTIAAGQQLTIDCTIDNADGGDSGNFDVAFYASTDTAITSSDKLIGTTRVSSINGNSSRSIEATFTFPGDISPGNWYLGWDIDSDKSASSWGEVGENDEGNNDGYDVLDQLVVTVPTAVGLISAETPTSSPRPLFIIMTLILISITMIKRQRFTN